MALTKQVRGKVARFSLEIKLFLAAQDLMVMKPPDLCGLDYDPVPDTE